MSLEKIFMVGWARNWMVFWVPKEARWGFLQKNAKQPDIRKIVDDAMVAIERDNPSLKGVLPKDYARRALEEQRLGELIDLVGTITLAHEQNRSKDILGRVYEYFLAKFASAEGKKGGQFYTPRCVVKVLVKMLAPYKGRVFDPCCGSGGMFVQSEEFIEEHGGRIGDISIYGQESNPTTWRLAKMNLAIRGIDNNLGAHNADSFLNDLHPDLKADYVLANPPFNDSDWHGELLRDDKRWKFGIPPVSNANFAWVQHFSHHLAPNGIAGFVLAQVSLDSESPSETEIRRGIVEADLVDCVVTLPEKLFYSTPTPVCLWLIARNKNDSRFRKRCGEVLFIDAGNLGTPEDRTHNFLDEDAIAKIASVYHEWRDLNGKFKSVSGFCKSVSVDEVRTGHYSLYPAKYIGIGQADHGVNIDFSSQIMTRVLDYRRKRDGLVAIAADVDANITAFLEQGKVHAPKSFSKFRLGEILECSEERLGNRPEPDVLSCTERAGLVFQKERFSKRVATEDTRDYKVVRRTDIVYNPYLLWAGAIDQCWIVEFGITSPAYEVLKIKKGFDPTLIGTLLKSPLMIKTYHGISVGTVQRRRRAPVEKFLQLEVEIPSLDDQRDFSKFSSAVQQEIASLKDVSGRASEILHIACNCWLSKNSG